MKKQMIRTFLGIVLVCSLSLNYVLFGKLATHNNLYKEREAICLVDKENLQTEYEALAAELVIQTNKVEEQQKTITSLESQIKDLKKN